MDMDGFSVKFDPDDWPSRSEYRIVEIDRDEQDQPLNLDVWQHIEFYMAMEQEAGL